MDPTARARSLRQGKEQFIPVRITDLKGLGSPPLFLGRNVVLSELTPKVGESIRGELHVQARSISPLAVFAEDDLAFAMIDLTDGPGAVALMPTLLKAKHVDIKANRAVQFRDEENRARIPPMNSLASHADQYAAQGARVNTNTAGSGASAGYTV